MANFIRVPMYGATSGSKVRYGLVNVTNAYDVAVSGSDEHIRIFTTVPADTNDVQVNIIEYKGGSAVVTSQDLLNFKNLIIQANQEPGSNPIFNLEGLALQTDQAGRDKYYVDDFTMSSIAFT
jgi:hypothetical protein